MVKTKEEILNAKFPSDIFSKDLKIRKIEYRSYIKIYHPDINKELDSSKILSIIVKFYENYDNCNKVNNSSINIVYFHTKNSKKIEVSYNSIIPFELGTIYKCSKSIVFVTKNKKYYYNFINAMKNIPNELNVISAKSKSDIVYFDLKDDEFLIIVSKDIEEISLNEYYSTDIKDKFSFKEKLAIMDKLMKIISKLSKNNVVINGIDMNSIYINTSSHNLRILGGWWYSTPISKKLLGTTKDIFSLMESGLKISIFKTDIDCVKKIMMNIMCCINIMQFKFNNSCPDNLKKYVLDTTISNGMAEYIKWRKLLFNETLILKSESATPIDILSSEYTPCSPHAAPGTGYKISTPSPTSISIKLTPFFNSLQNLIEYIQKIYDIGYIEIKQLNSCDTTIEHGDLYIYIPLSYDFLPDLVNNAIKTKVKKIFEVFNVKIKDDWGDDEKQLKKHLALFFSYNIFKYTESILKSINSQLQTSDISIIDNNIYFINNDNKYTNYFKSYAEWSLKKLKGIFDAFKIKQFVTIKINYSTIDSALSYIFSIKEYDRMLEFEEKKMIIMSSKILPCKVIDHTNYYEFKIFCDTVLYYKLNIILKDFSNKYTTMYSYYIQNIPEHITYDDILYCIDIASIDMPYDKRKLIFDEINYEHRKTTSRGISIKRELDGLIIYYSEYLLTLGFTFILINISTHNHYISKFDWYTVKIIDILYEKPFKKLLINYIISQVIYNKEDLIEIALSILFSSEPYVVLSSLKLKNILKNILNDFVENFYIPNKYLDNIPSLPDNFIEKCKDIGILTKKEIDSIDDICNNHISIQCILFILINDSINDINHLSIKYDNIIIKISFSKNYFKNEKQFFDELINNNLADTYLLRKTYIKNTNHYSYSNNGYLKNIIFMNNNFHFTELIDDMCNKSKYGMHIKKYEFNLYNKIKFKIKKYI